MGEVGSVTDQVCSNHLKSLKGRAKNDSFPVPESQSFIFDVSTYKWVPMGPCERGDKHSELLAVWVLFGSDQKSTSVLNNSLLETADRC